MSPPNKTLKGHKLLLSDTRELPEGGLSRLRASFPDLRVEGWDADADDPWADTTIALANSFRDDGDPWGYTNLALKQSFGLPPVEQAKKLQLVQLTSAGADGIIGRPIFEDTKIAFCTASGIHGPQIAEWVVSTFLAFQHHRKCTPATVALPRNY
ncbi:hypothetical protein NLG97_g5010 [Lecanicillium saksenae]|uniref:Uncharacterized protein n=1 Tax=Lecanicillium saksenae TaxID=468837 RepID=A0ACC1QVC0_9HYPO|nr:hypothetical protein NLG97_g5010 [Lecanicillium saksenae]